MGTNSNDYPRALRTPGYDFVPATEISVIPAESQIRVKQRVYDLVNGSVGDLYIATLSPLPNGGFEITTLAGDDEVLIEFALPPKPARNPARGRRGRRS